MEGERIAHEVRIGPDRAGAQNMEVGFRHMLRSDKGKCGRCRHMQRDHLRVGFETAQERFRAG